jgi:hypothetical protein
MSLGYYSKLKIFIKFSLQLFRLIIIFNHEYAHDIEWLPLFNLFDFWLIL